MRKRTLILLLGCLLMNSSFGKKKAIIFLEPKGTIFEVIREAKQQGFEVVAIMSNPELLEQLPQPYASAKACVSKLAQIGSWGDLKAVYDIVGDVHKQTPIAGIYSGVEPAAVASAQLREKYGFPTPSVSDLEIILDKYLLRKRLSKAGLSELQAYSAEEADKLTHWPFKGSAYLKPRRGLASLHVTKVTSLEEYREARRALEAQVDSDPQHMRDYIRSGPGFFLEEAIEGELLSVEAICSRGEYHGFGLLSRILLSDNEVIEMGSVFPYNHPRQAEILKKAERIHKTLGYTDGLSHAEFIVSPEGEIEIIDLNPRFVGADVLQSINNAYGTKLQTSLLDFAQGKFRPLCHQIEGYCCLQYGLAPKGETKVASLSLPESESVVFQSPFVSPGDTISGSGRQLDYVGCYLVKAPTFDEAVSESQRLRSEFLLNGEASVGF